MLSKFSNSRTLSENKQLGALTAFSAGMVNIASLILFFAFTSNVTGHYAILAEEIAKGNWYQIAVVFAWIFLFFFGNFVSNFIVINLSKNNTYLAHAVPLILEIVCLMVVGIYGQHFYRDTLTETEVLISFLLFAMGLQNGLTASISNFVVKTTHLTGTTTDLGILFSMFTKRKYREKKELTDKASLLMWIAGSYLAGGVVSGLLSFHIGFKVFYTVSILLIVVIMYDFSKIKLHRMIKGNKEVVERRYRRIEVLSNFEREKKEESLV